MFLLMFAKIAKIGERGKENRRKDTRKEQTVRQAIHTRRLRTAFKRTCRIRTVRIRKGAFRRAESKKQGFWEEAVGGTLFLDEIGNLSLEIQQMLPRALETKQYRSTGGSKDKKADVRIIAATNEELQTAIAEKRFRADLYQQLKEYTLHIPPLR